MVKVSITLPNNAQITFESEEPEVIHEIVGMVLRDLPRELMQSAVQPNGNGTHQSGEPANSKSSAHIVSAPLEIAAEETAAPPPPIFEESPPKASSPKTSASSHKPVPDRQPATDGEARFIEFCRANNPVGDMRRVVVAAEGATRFLGVSSIDAQELGRLFDLAGWPRPHSFVQTLRNAARTKFRWLQRVPGRSGQYTVTDLGRSTALNQ